MDDLPTARELRGAARSCTVLAYAAGLAGVAAGTLVLREGDVVFAVITWVVTFAVGASLMGVAVLVRAMSSLTVTLTRIESDVRVLVADRSLRPETARVLDDDPWSGHDPR
ncbi:MAG: hypothetical protein WDZ26_02515 [Nitriliruptoraceae bacterium]